MRQAQESLSFERLWAFASEYSLAPVCALNDVRRGARQVHKQAYPLLIWKFHVCVAAGSRPDMLAGEPFLRESASDISTSVFLFIQGVYKPALLMLRASIENFMRFMFFIHAGALSVQPYSPACLFEHLYEFSSDYLKNAYVCLRVAYSELSSYVHSAGPEFMVLIDGVSAYPCHDKSKDLYFTEISDRVMGAMNYSMAYMMNEIFHNMHHTEKDAILGAMDSSLRGTVMELRR